VGMDAAADNVSVHAYKVGRGGRILDEHIL
jgi:hypothetical protein